MKNISFVLMFIPLISFAQTYKYIGIEDGLSNRRIFDIQKDSKGYYQPVYQFDAVINGEGANIWIAALKH